ncbi:hypothetical protein QVD17_18283 [Tagetes erecta]|uniref:Uncharacterized protein n=1 Tax=Tagetes erecta TaxID=13708 RepID=A0AAD8KHH1_TARER|nr:hypothetical protein QVD17_18283 [Tagetes erecta]
MTWLYFFFRHIDLIRVLKKTVPLRSVVVIELGLFNLGILIYVFYTIHTNLQGKPGHELLTVATQIKLFVLDKKLSGSPGRASLPCL